MAHNYLLSCLFGISTCLLASTVARKAIIGGIPTSINLFPYQVSVQLRGHGHVCGGGIIENRFILTAAHCVLNHRTRHLRSSHISILAGTNNLNKTGPPTVSVRVEKVFFPAEYHPMANFNLGDIAVLKLVDSLQLDYRTSTTRTHLKKLDLLRSYTNGLQAVTVGFGWNKYNDGVGSTNGHLRLILSHLFSNEECEKAFPDGAIQVDVHFCAKAQPLDAMHGDNPYGVCNGDDGSPLVRGATFIIGILSRISPNCDERHEPAVYTRVAYYSTMIINVVEHGHDSKMTSLHAT